MNREDRRKFSKAVDVLRTLQKKYPNEDIIEMPGETKEIDNGSLCQGIMYAVNQLRERGYPLIDFDHKDRSLQQIQILGDKIFFYAAPEEEHHDGEKEN